MQHMIDIEFERCFSNDHVMHVINKNFIALDDVEVKRNNSNLTEVIRTLMEQMKLKDDLFANAYREIIFCGSFYKETRVGKPNEFDLNIILQLPINYGNINFHSNKPACTKIKIEDYLNPISTSPKYNLSNKQKKILKKLMVDDYLDPDKFRQWIEGVLSKVITDLPKVQDKYQLVTQTNFNTFMVKIKKSGPAFTLTVTISPTNEDISIDLVPALAFKKYEIHGSTLKLHEVKNYRNKTWYAIPLPLKDIDTDDSKGLHWRVSFCHQEREILARHGRVKPVIRLLKKFRDTQNWKNIASYFIETLFLNKLTELKEILNKISLTLFFFVMLKEMQHAFQQHRVEYFWDENYNLLEKIRKDEMTNITHRLNNIIKNIEKNAISNSLVFAAHILNKEELQLLQLRLKNKNIQHYESIQYTGDVQDSDNRQSTNNGRCIIL